jgi:hypothetical protein
MFRCIGVVLVVILSANLLLAAEENSLEERRRSNKLSRNTPNIYQVSMKEGVTYQLQTAIGYITTIDLPEEARKVFVGDAELFKIEVYGPQVIIKPATDYDDARTNLTIYTASGRLTFDVTVGDPDTADFVMDFRFPKKEAMVENEFKAQVEAKREELQKTFNEKEAKQEQKVQELSQKKFEEEMKTGAKSKRLQISKKQDNVQLTLLTLTEIGGKSYLRINIFNESEKEYEIQRVVLGKETLVRKGLFMEPEGFYPVTASTSMDKTLVSKKSYQTGLLCYPKVSLQKNEQLTLKVYGGNNPKPIEITKIPTQLD